MAKPRKRKLGLQKELSSVFEGVPIPQTDDSAQTPPKSTTDIPLKGASKPTPKHSLVSNSSLMKKVCRSQSSSDKAVEKTTKSILSNQMDLDPPALQDSTTEKSSRAKDKPNKTIEDIVKTVFSKQPAEESSSPQDSTIPTPHRTEDKPDKAASNRSVGSLPELKDLDPLIPHLSPTEKPSRGKVSSEKNSSGRPISVPPKLTTPDDPILQRVLAKEPPQTDKTPDNDESDHTIESPSIEAASDHTIAQVPQVEESPEGKDLSDDKPHTDQTLNIPSWMMRPDSTDSQDTETSEMTPDHPISQDSSTKTSDPMKIIRDEIEVKARRSDDSLKSAAGEASASKGSLYSKLLQVESTSEISEPDRPAEAASTLKSEERQASQEPESGKRYDPEAPQQDADSSSSLETTDLTEVSGPNLWQRINSKLFAPKPGVSSTRQKAMVVLIPILFIILIFSFRQVLSNSPQKTKGTPAKDAPEVVVKAEPTQEIDWQIPEPLPVIMRDPTVLSVPKIPMQRPEEQPIQTTKQKKSDLINLGSIVYSEDKSSAIVNGRIVHAGDKISGITVLKIYKDSVEFEKDGERWVQRKHK